MKFIVISDIHYRSRRFLEFEEHKSPQPDAFLDTAACEKGIKLAAETEDSDIILVTGDITDCGDKQSHEDIIKIFRALKSIGKKVYVITATHDFAHNKSYIRKPNDSDVKFKSEPWLRPFFDKEKCDCKSLVTDEFKNRRETECEPALAEVCKYEELKDLYYEFGPCDAISVFDGGHSYCVALDDKVWCLMLEDSFRDIENMPTVGSTFSPLCYNWIKGLVDRAEKENKFIFVCSHHPFVPPSPGYKVGADNKNMRCPEVGHILADMGIQLAFTGHSHFSDISFVESEKGALLCDITTPSLKNIPPRFRVVDLDPDNHTVEIKSIEISDVSGYDIPEGLPEFRNKIFIDGIKSKVSSLPSPLNSIIENLKIGSLCPLVKHSGGLSKEEIESIKNKLVFDLLAELVINLQAGDGKYTPDTAEYKFMMGLATFLDSIIQKQPFYDIQKNLLKGYTVKEIIEPLLFNNYMNYANCKFDFTRKPKPEFEAWNGKSHAGDILMIILSIIAVVFSPLASVAAVFALPVLTVRKTLKQKKNPTKPEKY